jgi:hypothetical protein
MNQMQAVALNEGLRTAATRIILPCSLGHGFSGSLLETEFPASFMVCKGVRAKLETESFPPAAFRSEPHLL